MAWWDHEELKPLSARSDRYKVAFPDYYTKSEVDEAKGRLGDMPRVQYESDHVTDRSLLSGRVRRYHTWPVLQEQTVGDHCWGVYHIYWRIFGLPSAEVALYIHVHDSDELVIGDNPFPMSARYPSLKAVKEEMGRDARVQLSLPSEEDIGHFDSTERARIKICDLLEMMQFGMQEREMGNLLAQPIIERTRAAAQEKARELEFTERAWVYSWIQTEVQRHQHFLRREGSTQ